MTLLARPGEKIEQTVNVESPAGKGILYATSLGLILEINGKGIYMDLKHDIIKSLINTGGNKVVVSWIENDKDNFSFEFKLDNASEFAESVSEKHEYSVNFSNDVTLKIPENIPENKRWNDAYYDSSRKAYITFNKAFEEFENIRIRDIQIKFDKEMGKNSGIIIEETKITVKNEIPAIIRENQNGNPVWLLIPTMTDEMLTDEIITNRLHAKSQDDAVIYTTVSEAWISMGPQKLMLTEREREVGVKIGKYADIPMEQLKLINFRK